MLRTFRRRNDQQFETGTAPLEPWVFHEQMKEMASQIATVVPPTVFSSFMSNGGTEDNRPQRVSRNNASGPRNGFSIESIIEAQNQVNDINFERSRPHRELMERFMTSSMEANTQSIRHMELQASSMERFIQTIERRTESLERISASLSPATSSSPPLPTQTTTSTSPPLPTQPTPSSLPLSPPQPTRTSFPSSGHLNENSNDQSESSRPSKRRRMSL
jgi:hypothetical protein